jgi:hypothetical protein
MKFDRYPSMTLILGFHYLKEMFFEKLIKEIALDKWHSFVFDRQLMAAQYLQTNSFL